MKDQVKKSKVEIEFSQAIKTLSGTLDELGFSKPKKTHEKDIQFVKIGNPNITITVCFHKT